MLVNLGMDLHNSQVEVYTHYDQLECRIVDYGGGIIEIDVDGLERGSYSFEAHVLRDAVMTKLPRYGTAIFNLPTDRSVVVKISNGLRLPPLTVKRGCNALMRSRSNFELVAPVLTLDGVEQDLDLTDAKYGIATWRLSGKHDPGKYVLRMVDGGRIYPPAILTIVPDILGTRVKGEARLWLWSTAQAGEATASTNGDALLEIWGSAPVRLTHEHDWLPLVQADGAGYVAERVDFLNGVKNGWFWAGEPNRSILMSNALLSDPVAFEAYANKAAIIGCNCKLEENHV